MFFSMPIGFCFSFSVMQGRVDRYLLKFAGHRTHCQNGAAALQSQLLSFYPAGSWGSSSEEEVFQRRRVENLIPFSLTSCLYQVASRPTNSQLEFWRGSLLGRAFSGDLSLFLKTGKCFFAHESKTSFSACPQAMLEGKLEDVRAVWNECWQWWG